MRIICYIPLLSIFTCLTACAQEGEVALKKNNEDGGKAEAQIYSYPEGTIPQFFGQIVDNHQKDFWVRDSASYLEFCAQHKIKAIEPDNKKAFFTIQVLHTLFTSKSAMNGSRGDVLNIPYLWHWVTPNPRHQVYESKSGRRLKEIKPTKPFGNYASFADIDRTPYLFLSDMVSGHNQYYTMNGDSFATFGWCSEREMAFVCLMKLLGVEGKVIAKGNHSWSELVVTLKDNGNKDKRFIVMVDNTFDDIRWENPTSARMNTWKAYTGRGKLSTWYNQKANSSTEGAKVKGHICDQYTVQQIEKALVGFLRRSEFK